MYVGMVIELLSPRVKDGEDAHLRSKALGVSAESQQGLRRGLE
jgi:hypothetical protein